MIKILLVSISTTFLISTSAYASGFKDDSLLSRGGFTGPNSVTITTVAQALSAGDDMPVLLTGHIKSSLGDELYLFSDYTGSIKVEIDEDEWQGQIVTPKTKVRLVGEIDRESNSVLVDVDAVNIINTVSQ